MELEKSVSLVSFFPAVPRLSVFSLPLPKRKHRFNQSLTAYLTVALAIIHQIPSLSSHSPTVSLQIDSLRLFIGSS